MGMSFLWESHGKRPMGWDGAAHIFISHETQKQNERFRMLLNGHT